MFIAAGPSGGREELPAPRAGWEAVEVMEATGSTPGLGPKDTLPPSTGLPLSWFSVSGCGWFTWKGLTGAEAVAAPGEKVGGAVAVVRAAVSLGPGAGLQRQRGHPGSPTSGCDVQWRKLKL